MGKNKVERNGSCPCGSGKKYKKCCLRLGKSDPFARGVPTLEAMEQVHHTLLRKIAQGGKLPGVDFHPWALEMLRDQVGVGPEGDRAGTCIAALRTLDTPALLRGLQGDGVEIDEPGFVALTDGYTSAWKLADEAWGSSHLVACELWRRLLPERPSLEMLAERMQQGYEQQERDALDTWFPLLEDLLRVLPDVRSLEQAEPLFPGLQSLDNWLGDFEIALHNAALDEPEMGRRGLALYDRIFAQWTEMERPNLFHRMVADLHDLVGDREQSGVIYRRLIEEDPQDPGYYCEWAMKLAHQDPVQARALLEEALARPVRDTSDVLEMLADLD